MWKSGLRGWDGQRWQDCSAQASEVNKNDEIVQLKASEVNKNDEIVRLKAAR